MGSDHFAPVYIGMPKSKSECDSLFVVRLDSRKHLLSLQS